MSRANVPDLEEFTAIAEYLDRSGWITEADADYGVFVLTPEALTRPPTSPLHARSLAEGGGLLLGRVLGSQSYRKIRFHHGGRSAETTS